MRHPLRHLKSIGLVFVIVAAICTASPSRADGPPEQVVVTNFPQVQQVSGKVAITETVPQSRFETLKALVSPAALAQANDWTEAGALDTRGFTHLTVSLAGNLQGSAQAGSIGVLLVPDVPEVLTALRTHGIAPLAARVEAPVSATLAGGFFSSETTTVRIGFPRYRVFLYNTTSRTAEAAGYAYLTEG
jgi:hypothetical protein